MQPTAGQLSLDNAPITLGNLQAVHGQGIYLAPQEPALMLELSVAETISRRAPPWQRLGWTSTWTGKPGISRSRSSNGWNAPRRCCRARLFDKPISPLTNNEVKRLFVIMCRLRDDGCTLGL